MAVTTALVAPSGAARNEARAVVVVPLLAAAALLVLTQLYVSIPLRDPIAAEFGTAAATAALATGYSLCYAAGFLIHGPLSDHFGRRPVLLWGLAALAASTAAVGLATTTPALAGLRAVQGLAAATFAPTALAYVAEGLPPRRRALAVGAISVAFLIAGILGQLAAAALGTAAGWRSVFWLSGAALAVVTAVAAAGIREPRVERPPRRLRHRYLGLARFALRPRSLLLGTGHLVVLGGFVALYTLLGPHLARSGLTGTETMLVRAAALPAMLCSLTAGPLLRRFGPRRTALLGFATAATGLAAAAALASSPAGLTAATTGFVAGVAVSVPAMITIWGDAAHPDRGTGMAVNGFVLFLGAGLGSSATALPANLPAALTLLACLYLAAGLMVHTATGRSLDRAVPPHHPKE